jgi:flagellar biosynthesis chaperone FliJ
MPTMGEVEARFEDYEQEQQEDDLTELERIVDEIHFLQSRLRALTQERSKLERRLGLPVWNEDNGN